MPAIRIFMSYRHHDSLDDVYAILQKLNNFFGDTAIVSDNLGMPAQANIGQWIEKTIQSCDVVLLMIGENWSTLTDAGGNSKLFNPADAVLLEIACAFKYKKRIIPCILPGGAIPAAEDLPDIIKDLVYINAAVIPPTSAETDWGGVLAQVINSIEKAFRFYTDKLFWLLVFAWPVVISIITFFCSMVISKIGGKFGIILPPVRHAGFYYLATGIVWTGMYALKTATDYTAGQTGIFFIPFEPLKFIFYGGQDLLCAVFLGFPLNIFFAWLMADAVAFIAFKYVHISFELYFLVAYVFANYILLSLFSSSFAGNGRGDRNYEKLFPAKPRAKNAAFDESVLGKKIHALVTNDRNFKSGIEKKIKQAWLEKNAEGVRRGL
ncbi:MAG: hypothetical protein ABJB86_04005 [Bacteroidota bacterium]